MSFFVLRSRWVSLLTTSARYSGKIVPGSKLPTPCRGSGSFACVLYGNRAKLSSQARPNSPVGRSLTGLSLGRTQMDFGPDARALMGAVTTPSVPNRRRQEFEVSDLELAPFFNKNNLEIEIRIKIAALLQLVYTDALSLRNVLKFLR